MLKILIFILNFKCDMLFIIIKKLFRTKYQINICQIENNSIWMITWGKKNIEILVLKKNSMTTSINVNNKHFVILKYLSNIISMFTILAPN